VAMMSGLLSSGLLSEWPSVRWPFVQVAFCPGAVACWTFCYAVLSFSGNANNDERKCHISMFVCAYVDIWITKRLS